MRLYCPGLGRWGLVWLTAVSPLCSQARTVISVESLLPDDPTTHYSRRVNFAPGDGEVVDLNPPRFRWFYHPQQADDIPVDLYTFRFQVARDAHFTDLVVDAETPFNFYNTISPLSSEGSFYWRVHYRPQDAERDDLWSQTRSFRIAPQAQIWDRSLLAEPDFSGFGHPRILFDEESLPKLRELVRINAESRTQFEYLQRHVDERLLQAPWWNRLPVSDRERIFDEEFHEIGRELAIVAFVYAITGDERYAEVVPQAVQLARYPIGGLASPEGAGGGGSEDATQLTEFLALLYDWLHPHLSPAERTLFVRSLDWRIDHFLHDFAWMRRRDDGSLRMHGGSLATVGASHAFEGFFDTFPACLAIYEHSEAARRAFHLGVNYMAGIGSAHGFSEGWNEGPGYGNSKWKWQINAMSYLDSMFPEYDVAANPWLRRTGEFFRFQTPVGLQHSPWGHGSNRQSYYRWGHVSGYRKLAFLTGDGRFLADWAAWGGDLSRGQHRGWIECALPLWRQKPTAAYDEPGARVFPRSGWVMAASGPPSDPATYEEGVGVVFAARPRGGYSHSFGSDNSFQLFAYGQDLTHAAGDGGYEPHAYHSMSHNTVLVDGLGQFTGRNAATVPVAARLLAYHEGDGFVYWAGDATMAYPRAPGAVRFWWGGLDELYEARDARHLQRFHRHVLFVRDRYFVVLDDLVAQRPSRFSWLYHVLPEADLHLQADTGSFRYWVDDVAVHVTHVLGAGRVDAVDQAGRKGYVNPLTDEDYSEDLGRSRGRELVAAHNLYVTNREPTRNWRFLSTIVPVPAGADTPRTERLDELTARVTFLGQSEVISFDPSHTDADIVVDLRAIADGADGIRPR